MTIFKLDEFKFEQQYIIEGAMLNQLLKDLKEETKPNRVVEAREIGSVDPVQKTHMTQPIKIQKNKPHVKHIMVYKKRTRKLDSLLKQGWKIIDKREEQTWFGQNNGRIHYTLQKDPD